MEQMVDIFLLGMGVGFVVGFALTFLPALIFALRDEENE